MPSIFPKSGDPHFPILCADLPGACCDGCHAEDVTDALPLLVLQDPSGQVVLGQPVDGQEILGFSCCLKGTEVREEVIDTLIGHVAKPQADCAFCQLSGRLR